MLIGEDERDRTVLNIRRDRPATTPCSPHPQIKIWIDTLPDLRRPGLRVGSQESSAEAQAKPMQQRIATCYLRLTHNIAGRSEFNDMQNDPVNFEV